MIDHTGIIASNFEKSKVFYAKALAPIGYALLMEFPASVTGHADVAGFGEPPKPDFWVSSGTPNNPPIHVAFRVASRALVDDFTRRPWRQADATTASLACVLTITQITTARLFLIQTVTTLRPYVTSLSSHAYLDPHAMRLGSSTSTKASRMQIMPINSYKPGRSPSWSHAPSTPTVGIINEPKPATRVGKLCSA